MNKQFAENRARFPAAELAKYRGQWVAFSLDGSRIIAGAATLDELEDRLAALGQDPEAVAFESVPGPEDDIFLGGAELS